MTTALGAVSEACRARLTAHYGNAVASWLDAVPAELVKAARRWKLTSIGYHDAGHASVLARGVTEDGTSVMVKAWSDHERYRHETAALMRWTPINGRVIRDRDDERALACLDLIGGSPGGQVRPHDDAQQVAQAWRGAITRPHRITTSPALRSTLRRAWNRESGYGHSRSVPASPNGVLKLVCARSNSGR